MKLNLNLKQDELKCEQCGSPINEGNAYTEEKNGKIHYFCCSHCAEKYFSKHGENI
nr:DUF2175 family protein [Acidianus sp. RZ1]